MVDEMNKSDWEYPTGWPETKAQRETLRNALLERMLEWGGRNAKFSLPGHKQKSSKPPKQKPIQLPKLPPMPVHSSYLSAELINGQLHSAVAAMNVRSRLRKLIERDGLRCCWCGRVCNPTLRSNADAYPTREHVLRRADGGTNAMANLKVACRKCNNSRHDPGWKPPTP